MELRDAATPSLATPIPPVIPLREPDALHAPRPQRLFMADSWVGAAEPMVVNKDQGRTVVLQGALHNALRLHGGAFNGT